MPLQSAPISNATAAAMPGLSLAAVALQPRLDVNRTTRREIERAIAHVFEVASADIDLPRRGRARVALARQTAMYLVHVTCGLSLSDVGDLFARDRTTVRHACGLIEDMRDDHTFDLALQCLEGVVLHLAELCAGPVQSRLQQPTS